MDKIEALQYLVKNERHYSEWQGVAMYLKCKIIITSKKTSFTKDELNKMLKEVEAE